MLCEVMSFYSHSAPWRGAEARLVPEDACQEVAPSASRTIVRSDFVTGYAAQQMISCCTIYKVCEHVAP
jgi:hypothetical protein